MKTENIIILSLIAIIIVLLFGLVLSNNNHASNTINLEECYENFIECNDNFEMCYQEWNDTVELLITANDGWSSCLDVLKGL